MTATFTPVNLTPNNHEGPTMSTFTITNTTDAHITISFAPPTGAPADLPSPFGTVEVVEVQPKAKIGRPFGSLPDYSFVNAARRWTPNEDRLLLALAAGGMKPNKIAKVIGRSPKAVSLRINGLKSKSQ